jgi:hypothetical protein
MRLNRGLRVALCGMWLAASGCTSLREIPRSSFASRAQRDHVRVETSEGLVYEFDYARFAADSVVGFRRRDVESRVDEYDALGLPLDQVKRLSARGTDWRRTGLVGGGVLAAVIVAAFRIVNNNSPDGGTSPGIPPRTPPQ